MAAKSAVVRRFCCHSRLCCHGQPPPRILPCRSSKLESSRGGRNAARTFHDAGRCLAAGAAPNPPDARPEPNKPGARPTPLHSAESLAEYKKYFHFPSASAGGLEVGSKLTVHGFLSRRRVKHSKLVFADISAKSGPPVQVTASFEDENSPEALVNRALKAIPLHSPVSVSGIITECPPRGGDEAKSGAGAPRHRINLALESIQSLNPFPQDIIVSKGVQFPPEARHLQIRFSESIRQRLDFRSYVNRQLRESLERLNFREYETPILFKSTPEGAREFVVPTRRRARAYALPQSPQQYKQILMASGIGNYYQFARCFRDEDLRADRQPEFTQLDLEMSFATGEDVMRAVETVVKELLARISVGYTLREVGNEFVPYPASDPPPVAASDWHVEDAAFPRISYEEAMAQYGSDKPDTRIPFRIRRLDPILPQSFTSMITYLDRPIIEAIKVRLEGGGGTQDRWSFVQRFMDKLPGHLAKNPEGAPAMLMFDSAKPMCGLSALGHEAFAGLTSGGPGLEEFADLEDGDVLIIQARENMPFRGGSTALGELRSAVYQEAVQEGLLPRDNSLAFLWVHGFPLFTPDSGGEDPGQGGRAGFSATHHPFTAPLTDEDFELLATDPLRAKADHYDLVLNGVELGGGSRRIHVAKVQEYVMRSILEMTDAGVAQFSHLLEALRAGCPPHAGFAFGFDRLVAMLSRTGSVRDVIAFPKSKKGDDPMVKSPGRITSQELETYHLAIRPKT